jgi:hypothetical protein
MVAIRWTVAADERRADDRMTRQFMEYAGRAANAINAAHASYTAPAGTH